MSFLLLGLPFEAIGTVTHSLMGAASPIIRPLIGLGVFATLLVVFKPLIAGLLRAGLLLLSPRLSFAQREERSRVRNAIRLNRLARSLETQHPSLASELHALNSRDC